MSRLLQKITYFFSSFFSEKENEKPKANTLKISDEIVLNVMERLSHFEQTKGFLKPMTLHKLAKKLKTNPKYLSRIINDQYQKNYSSYINDLRISYLLKALENDDSLKKVTVKSLAKKLGFGNTESFAKAFKKYTGVNPSVYLNSLP
ncbi:TCP pilus virulence regulatory protein [Kordia sp. SMS9]|uniref:helix-turn-helix domain-containing protein n=1 Tax=Kordia sp. SMS9 TaxID=2282170 RepID=UPI000E0D75AC|nr:helix-turn-helix domain-containing protein [Kordia sp. SMS9]AXG68331.1 TCP pilus virulence regulatory protein [Kordia sp. SMS9]